MDAQRPRVVVQSRSASRCLDATVRLRCGAKYTHVFVMSRLYKLEFQFEVLNSVSKHRLRLFCPFYTITEFPFEKGEFRLTPSIP